MDPRPLSVPATSSIENSQGRARKNPAPIPRPFTPDRTRPPRRVGNRARPGAVLAGRLTRGIDRHSTLHILPSSRKPLHPRHARARRCAASRANTRRIFVSGRECAVKLEGRNCAGGVRAQFWRGPAGTSYAEGAPEIARDGSAVARRKGPRWAQVTPPNKGLGW